VLVASVVVAVTGAAGVGMGGRYSVATVLDGVGKRLDAPVDNGVVIAMTPAWLRATRSSAENVNTPLLKFSTKRRALLPDATKLSESCVH